jgi:hypothetical protein
VERNWQGRTEALGEKPVLVPLCPPQIPHEPTRNRTRVSVVRGRRLTAWAMARLYIYIYTYICIATFIHSTLHAPSLHAHFNTLQCTPRSVD